MSRRVFSGQRIGLVRRDRVADAGLHVAPPAVIGAGEANQAFAAGVIAGEAHRLHHGFGAGHVERDLVEPGNLAQPPHIIRDHGMIGAEHRAQRMGALFCRGDALPVKIIAEDVDAVGAGQVVEHIAIDIGDGDAGRGLHKGTGRKMLPHQPAVLERHPVGLGELQVGDALGRLRRHLPAGGVALLVEPRQPEEAVLPPGGDISRRSVGAEEIVDIELIERHQPRHQAGHFGMSGQGTVFGPRKSQAGVQFGEDGRGAGYRSGGQGQNRKGRIHATSAIQCS
jgi:hypothetical protein